MNCTRGVGVTGGDPLCCDASLVFLISVCGVLSKKLLLNPSPKDVKLPSKGCLLLALTCRPLINSKLEFYVV